MWRPRMRQSRDRTRGMKIHNLLSLASRLSVKLERSMEQDDATGVTFALEGEDHTLANAVRFMLNKK